MFPSCKGGVGRDSVADGVVLQHSCKRLLEQTQHAVETDVINAMRGDFAHRRLGAKCDRHTGLLQEWEIVRAVADPDYLFARQPE
jgi:hypothetical protein